MVEMPGIRMLAAVERAVGVALRTVGDVAPTVQSAIAAAEQESEVDQFRVQLGSDRFLVHRIRHHPADVLVLGPYRSTPSIDVERPVLDQDAEQWAATLLCATAAGLSEIHEERHFRIEVASQLELISSAAIAITSEIELEVVLRRIVDLARELAGARYAALGVPDDRGQMSAFLTSGLSPDEEARIGHPPRGLGILGLLLREPRTIRLRDLREHAASVGFPPNHPPMHSFLGVPIITRGRVVGNLYLTEKQFSQEFSADDARLVEMLARHAAVAIEHAQLYQRLALEQRRLELLIDQLPEAILVAEPHPDRVTMVNRQASELLGWQINPPIPFDLFFGMNRRFSADGVELSPREIPLVHMLRHGEPINRREIRLARPDGRHLTILVNGAPLKNEQGEVIAALAVFQDITVIKDAEQLKDDFLSLVSHELRTPLTTIQGGAHMLMHDDDLLDQETRRMILADISTESRRLGILVENMVQLANIRAGRFSMETEPVHVEHLVSQAIKAVEGAAPNRVFRFDVDSELLVDADPQRLDQVLRNLLHNAIKYSPDGESIEVSARRKGDVAIISVRDHGPGIAAEDIPHVFDRFRRGSIQGGRIEGMGLGLYLSKHLVEAHGGRIWMEQANGDGTIVQFTVPEIIDHD